MSEPRELWLAGKLGLGQWEVQGLYSTESAAVDRCEDITWFVMPLRVDEHIPSKTVFNPRGYYPKARP